MPQWRDCFVIFFDLIGTKERATNPRQGSASLRSFHKVVCKAMGDGFRSISHAYIWNDSVLLIAYVDSRSYEQVMRDADELKRLIDKHTPCYAIAVKGQAFPLLGDVPSRVTVLRTSSYAMANCFEIEKKARSFRLRRSWYIDSRIAKLVKQAYASEFISVKMLPGSRDRRVFLHGGYLWEAW